MYRTALARTHRPRRFSELVGQDHVASTLASAVENGRTAHAYLFCGPRGIGKTTAARVLAMALNCANRQGGEPCGECDSCDSIWSGRTSLDVVEIDAASNRGVDDARDLRERAMYAPSDENRYKVYIVDEAHMLTREAWNALLKILEEPPPRVIFVFATTEPNKIRQTAEPVLSRCQRFDFRRVSVPDLLERLRTVIGLEGAEADDAALIPIARRADGGVRDALSLLDQVLSFSGDSIAATDVQRMLGLVAEERYLELLNLIREGDRAGVFPFVQGLLDDGYDLAEFVRGLSDTLRAILALRLDPTHETGELTPDSRSRLTDIGERFSAEELLRLLVATADFESAGRFRRSAQPRIQIEVLLLRLVSLDSSLDLEDLLAALASGDAPGTGTAPAGGRRRDTGDTRTDSPSPSPRGGPGAGPIVERVSPPVVERPRDRHAEDTPRTVGASDLRTAWSEALEAARGSAVRGQLMGLRGARIGGYEAGEIKLQVPAGLASDLDSFLNDPRRSAALRAELGSRLGTPAGELHFRVDDSGPRRRITAESARDQKLQSMIETDPRLKEAVETLDLKLTEE